jgi:hypothetical protein
MRTIEVARRTTRIVRELATAFALLGFSVPAFAASILPVGNCLDDGSPQSLRNVVASAASGDVVDLSNLVCSTITLAAEKGPIPVTKGIIMHGFSMAATRIQGNGSRVFTITAGKDTTVIFLNLSISDGSVHNGSAVGGCISSDAYRDVFNAAVLNCSASSDQFAAGGGAIYTSAGANLASAYIRQNHVTSGTFAEGGGVFVAGKLNLMNSTISGNEASGASAQGGGAFVGDTLTMAYSTVDHNRAIGNSDGGGIFVVHSDPNTYASAILKQATFSANSASHGGALVHACYYCAPLSQVRIYNSTFAFNTGVVSAGGIVSNVDVAAYSSIFANNHSLHPRDVELVSATFSGADNLVMDFDFVTQPGVVTVTADPKLTPLAFHGAASPGHGRTHGLSLSSPALSAGSNGYGFIYDERGIGFPRAVDGKVDIGAFQRQPNDEELLFGGFE